MNQPEIGNFGDAIVTYQNIGWLQVPVDESRHLANGMLHPPANVQRDLQRVLHIKPIMVNPAFQVGTKPFRANNVLQHNMGTLIDSFAAHIFDQPGLHDIRMFF